MMIDDKRLAGIAERLAAATVGPWHTPSLPQAGDCLASLEQAVLDVEWVDSDGKRRTLCFTNSGRREDAAFLAASRADVEYLLAAVRHLQEELHSRDDALEWAAGAAEAGTSYVKKLQNDLKQLHRSMLYEVRCAFRNLGSEPLIAIPVEGVDKARERLRDLITNYGGGEFFT